MSPGGKLPTLSIAINVKQIVIWENKNASKSASDKVQLYGKTPGFMCKCLQCLIEMFRE
jgi:hypothetical protein